MKKKKPDSIGDVLTVLANAVFAVISAVMLSHVDEKDHASLGVWFIALILCINFGRKSK